MPPVERNHPIETLASCGSDDALTMCVRLRRAHRRLDHLERHRPKGFVNGGREDAVTIVDEHAIHAIERQAVAELLDGPVCRGMLGEIPVHDSACVDVEGDKDVQPLKRGRDHDEEVASEHGAGRCLQCLQQQRGDGL